MNPTNCDTAILADLNKVPPFPAVAAKLLSLLSAEDVDVNEAADLISSDAALTGRLLQHVNSAAYRLTCPVMEVGQAVNLAGIDRTRQLTAMSATSAYAARALHNAELQRCWQHSLATAVLGEEISKACGAFAKIAFTAGILHDIGRLGLMIAYPDQYTQAIRDANGRYLDLLDFEQEQFGIDHAEAGRLLAETWKLPAEFRVIAGRHHDPCEGSELDLLRIIHVACHLADALGFCVVPPRNASDVSAIFKKLPASAAKHLDGTLEDLRSQVEDHISKVM
jgi:putative nucleotidyltransferase with HDIG domain